MGGTGIVASALALLCAGCAQLWSIPRPADFDCLELDERHGWLVPLELQPGRIYGLGLTYASHARETGSSLDPAPPPPVFRKGIGSLNLLGSPVRVPSRGEIIAALEEVEPGLGGRVDAKFEYLPPLLDYEVELAFVLLEDVECEMLDDPGYRPGVGYFLANDISARAVAILGEGRPNRIDFWGASKSFPGFLPIGTHVWIPHSGNPDSCPCVELTTAVNGELRQSASTRELMYTPRRMLKLICDRYSGDPPRKGDVVLTGTPGGVALQVSPWKARAADFLGLDRFTKLSSTIRSAGRDRRFLKPGDDVVVSGGILGEVRTAIVR
jgi:2-keto-4-pentenoate hydratase/2-oxohepta-3-ene-1,7-dioic acid hydratase in catechol pathway